jgi:hypothetical protein
MRTLLLVTFAVLIGVALGIGAATMRFRATPWNSKLDESVAPKPAAAAPTSGPSPKVVVDKTEYDFGAVDIESSGGSHDFVFTNKGDAPLSLTAGGTSCRCTMSKLADEKIAPGKSTKVTLTWKAIDKPGPYQQTAKITTNDPALPQVTLTVGGRVTAAMRFSPSELVFSRLAAGEKSTAESKWFCYLDTPIKILGHKWANEATASYYDVAMRPLSAEELKEENGAKSGTLVTVTVKPGQPQGPIHQKLILQTNSPSSPTLSIEGTIGSEIAVVGRGWDPDKGILNLGEVPRRTGLQRQLLLVVRGPLRKEVVFKPQPTSPSMLKVSIGKRTEINNGAVVQIPLTVEVPPGSPPANHLGSEQGCLGEINLETTHPHVPTLRILVRFAVED